MSFRFLYLVQPLPRIKLYLLGDFNVDFLKAEYNSDIADYFDSISSFNLFPHIILLTRGDWKF